MKNADILVLDFGSQYTQLIARRLREQGVYAELLPFNVSTQTIKAKNPKGIILSGGPASVYAKDAYFCDGGSGVIAGHCDCLSADIEKQENTAIQLRIPVAETETEPEGYAAKHCPA